MTGYAPLTSGGIVSICSFLSCIDIRTIGILQDTCLDGNIHKLNILLGTKQTRGLCLDRIMDHGLVARGQFDHTITRGIDVGTAGCTVDMAGSSLDSTVDLNQRIVGSAFNAVAAGYILNLHINVVCSAAVTQSGTCVVIVDPLIIVVNIDAVALTQYAAGSFFDIQLGTGEQNQILIQQDGSFLNRNIHMVGNGQRIVRGVNGRALANASLHRNGNIGNGNIAVDLYIQTAGAFQIILNNIAIFNNEHRIVGTDEGHGSTLKANQSNTHGKIASFDRTGMDGQGNFNVLHIVLVERKYPIALSADHLRGSITATEVCNLEGLINCAAALDLHRTGTGNETPCVQICTAFNGDLTAAVHFQEGGGAVGGAIGTKDTGLYTGQADRTIDSHIGAGCHGQGTVGSGLYIGIFTQGRCCGSQGIGSVIGDLHSNTGRNDVVACRQSAIACQGNGLIRSTAGVSGRSIQTLKQFCTAICEEHRCRGGVGEHSPNGHSLCGNQLISSRSGDHIICCKIDPSHKLAATAGNCHKGSAGSGAYSIDRTGSNGRAVDLHTAQGTICNRHIRLSSNFLYLKVAQCHRDSRVAVPCS